MTKPVARKDPTGPGSPLPGAIAIKRPIDRVDHPIESGNYRFGRPSTSPSTPKGRSSPACSKPSAVQIQTEAAIHPSA